MRPFLQNTDDSERSLNLLTHCLEYLLSSHNFDSNGSFAKPITELVKATGLKFSL